MTPDDSDLRRAREALEAAVETADDEDVRADLRETAASFAEFETGDPSPDHALLDEHLNTIRQAKRRTGEATDDLDRALEHAESYREDVSQA